VLRHQGLWAWVRVAAAEPGAVQAAAEAGTARAAAAPVAPTPERRELVRLCAGLLLGRELAARAQ
jgi:hypothetical protein